MENKNGDRLIPLAKAAEKLGVSKRTALRYFKRGILEGRQYGESGWTMIYRQSVEDLLDEH